MKMRMGEHSMSSYSIIGVASWATRQDGNPGCVGWQEDGDLGIVARKTGCGDGSAQTTSLF